MGVCGPRLLLPDQTIQASCQLFPTVLDKIVRQLPAWVGARWLRDVELADWDHTGVRDIDYVVGACQAIRMSALYSVGWLDERIFYGPEDVDLCLRMQRAGWQVEYVPAAVVMHLERRLTRKLWSALTARHVYGLGYFFWKHRYLLRRPTITAPRRAA